MRINISLHNLLFGLENFEPNSLTSIVDFVISHNEYNTITMFVRNSRRSARYLLDECELLISELNKTSDIQLAGLLVILAAVDGHIFEEMVSRTFQGIGEYNWSRAMAASYLIHKEVLSETVCKSA